MSEELGSSTGDGKEGNVDIIGKFAYESNMRNF